MKAGPCCYMLALLVFSPECVYAADSPSASPSLVVLGQPDAAQQAKVQTEEVAALAVAQEKAAAEAKAAEEARRAEEARKLAQEQNAQALFEDSLKRLLPLDKEQIQNYRKRADERDRALAPAPPNLKTRTVRVSLEPGRAPTPVYTTANVATSLVFHDATGQPWPITSITNGGADLYQILRPELPEGNLLNVIPLKAYGSSSIVVTLAKRDVPLVIRLQTDSVKSPDRNADALVLFQLAHSGPNAQAPMTASVRETVSSHMLAFLDHVPPKGAVRMGFEPADDAIELWKLGSVCYMRTRYSLMWPAWVAMVNGAGGIKCYELPLTSRVLVSRDGAIQTVTLKEGR